MEFEAGEIVWPSTTPQALNPYCTSGPYRPSTSNVHSKDNSGLLGSSNAHGNDP